MTKTRLMGLCILTGSAALAPAQAENTGNFNLLIGQKSLDNAGWGVLDEQAEFAVLIDFKEASWPVEIALGMVASADIVQVAGSDVEGVTSESLAGIRKTFAMAPKILPYVGGGLAFVQAERTAAGNTVDDAAVGYWLNAGLTFRLTDRINIGLDYRYSDADVTLGGTKIKAGGDHIGLFGGFHWE